MRRAGSVRSCRRCKDDKRSETWARRKDEERNSCSAWNTVELGPKYVAHWLVDHYWTEGIDLVYSRLFAVPPARKCFPPGSGTPAAGLRVEFSRELIILACEGTLCPCAICKFSPKHLERISIRCLSDSRGCSAFPWLSNIATTQPKARRRLNL
jgi:hypothetical protein